VTDHPPSSARDALPASQASSGGRRSVLTWRPPPGGPGWAASERARAVLSDPQGFGNYMTYRDAYRILGWDPAEIYRDGRIALDREQWADLGWMANHLGPSPRALAAMRDAVDEDHVGPYSPDLTEPLRDLMAERLLGRPRDEGFEVMGTEGAQAGVGYAALACLDPGDEVIATDPGYFHFVPALRLAGARPAFVRLGVANGWRLDPDEVAAALTPRTKMVLVCDPVNPFGTVQREDELRALLRLSAERRVVLLADTTHAAHRVDPDARHHPLCALAADEPEAVVLTASGLAHGYGMAAARIGALGGPPDLVRACLQVKIATVRLNTNLLAQVGAAAALVDDEWIRRGQAVIRRNLAAAKAVAPTVVDPEYGFSCVLACEGLGASAQEITVALCRRHVAVYPGDGLGEVGATTTIRVNLSDPDPRALERLAAAWPEAVAEAATRRYREGVRDFFLSAGTERGRRLAALLD
jgi:aspartate/methionine/tyrosine aminotransferase